MVSLVQPGVKNNASTETQGLCGVFCHFGGLVVVENPGIYALHMEFLTGIFPQQHYHGIFGHAMFLWMLWWITWHVSWCPFLGCLEKVRNIFSQMVAKHGGKNHGFRFRKKSPTKQNPRFWDGVNLTQEVKLVKGESCDPANWGSSSSTAWHHYLITRLDGHPGRW